MIMQLLFSMGNKLIPISEIINPMTRRPRSPFCFAQFLGQTYAEAKHLLQTQAKLNYVTRRRSDKGPSDRGGRRLPFARVEPMSISRSRIARRSVFRCMPSFLAALH